MKLLLACAIAPLAILAAPTAAADINISGINIGNDGNAHATFGNIAVAGPGAEATANGGFLNAAVAIRNSTATVTGGGIVNVALATSRSDASKQGPGSFNLVAAARRSESSVTEGSFNVAASLNIGSAEVTNGNFSINAGFGSNLIKRSTAKTDGVTGSLQIAFCGGTATSAKGHFQAAAPCIGID